MTASALLAPAVACATIVSDAPGSDDCRSAPQVAIGSVHVLAASSTYDSPGGRIRTSDRRAYVGKQRAQNVDRVIGTGRDVPERSPVEGDEHPRVHLLEQRERIRRSEMSSPK